MSWIFALLGAFIAAGILSQVALRVGWLDQREGEEHRKLRKQPVSLVGGAAILLGVGVAVALLSVEARQPLQAFRQTLAAMAWPGILGAFLLGLFDDLAPGGLSARVKFGGQLLVAALVAWYPGSLFQEASALECLGLGLLSLVAMNAVNLFDHADGLAGLLCALAMLTGAGPVAKLFAAGAVGYLPFNLFLRRSPGDDPLDVGEERARSAPRAMLGDSGSHMVGVLLATTPGAWWFLALPALDMVRVVIGRVRGGRPFWRGDRSHLGHLLEDIGFAPVTVAMIVGVALAPLVVTVGLMDGAAPLTAGLLSSAALYFGLLVMTDGGLPPGELDPAGSPGEALGSRAAGAAADREVSGSGRIGGADEGLENPSGPFAGPQAS